MKVGGERSKSPRANEGGMWSPLVLQLHLRISAAHTFVSLFFFKQMGRSSQSEGWQAPRRQTTYANFSPRRIYRKQNEKLKLQVSLA